MDEEKMICTNGPAMSPCGKYVYHNDSIAQKVHKYDIGEDGMLTNKRVFYSLKTGYPDGMTCDTEGHLWLAIYLGGCVVQLNKDTGSVMHTILVPAPLTTSCCFGGPEMSTLFITTSDRNTGVFSSAVGGATYAVKTKSKGLLSPEFKG